MPPRPCLHCGRLVPKYQTCTCRGTTAQRGYDSKHQRLRRALQQVIDDGDGWCTEIVCTQPTRRIPPGTRWELAHDKATGRHLGPAHRECNQAEARRRRYHRQ